jgi:hypothetical protein
MITTTAMNVTLFSAAVVLLAVFLRVLLGNRPQVRSTSARLLAVFGMFAGAGLYVWLSLGPEVDRSLAKAKAPAAVPGARGEVAAPLDV